MVHSVYAVVRAGGKQYRVEEGSLVTVDRVEGEPGSAVSLGEVLLIADGETVKAGTPTVAGAAVRAEIVAHGRGVKIVVFRYKNKTRSRRRTGARAGLTTLRIKKIEA